MARSLSSGYKMSHERNLEIPPQKQFENDHDIKTTPLRSGNMPIMKIFYNAGVRGSELISINKCRLYLKFFFLSDMVSGGKAFILQSALKGTQYDTADQFMWPYQGHPSERDWSVWRMACSTHLLIRQS
jgi:hypothetical protein